MRTDVIVFTRDLRLRDLPALDAAANADRVVPLFVFDPELLAAHASPNRCAVLLDALIDLRASLRDIGADLVFRRGPWVDSVAEVVEAHGAEAVHLSGDVSAHARRRDEQLRSALGDRARVQLHPGVTVVPPGTTSPSGGGHWKVFTPFHRRWLETEWRPVEPAPDSLALPPRIDIGELPSLEELIVGEPSPQLQRGGESVALDRLRVWASDGLESYEMNHNDLPADRTSRISADLHFGCLSPLEVATRLLRRPGGAAFVRQLAWRDFYHQLLAARPETAHEDVRSRGDRWNDAPEAFDAWAEGRTGFPVVDAGMRQLSSEGFMHNRARMIVASFLTKDLYIDWRRGARHFMSLLVDGDVANNQLNWQWAAGTGTDSNPNRIFNPTVQSKRFDPDGEYIRRYVPELDDVGRSEIHEPSSETRRRSGYPEAVVDHGEAVAAYRAAQEALRS